jgi:hypothetical protein
MSDLNNIWVGPFKNGSCILCGANDVQGCLASRNTHWLMRGFHTGKSGDVPKAVDKSRPSEEIVDLLQLREEYDERTQSRG